MKNKILSITIESRFDDSPDTSFLGKYTSKSSPWAIDRKYTEYVCKIEQRERIIEQLKERIELAVENDPDIQVETYRQRIEKRIQKIEQSFPFDSYLDNNEYRYFAPYAGGEKPGTPNYKKYAMQNYKRMESLTNGDWYFIGIIAKATIQMESVVLQHITSGGLWGIESDSGDYIKEVANEQIKSLRSELSSLGFSSRAITHAINRYDGEIKERG